MHARQPLGTEQRRLNLDAIEASLKHVQRHFERINSELTAEHAEYGDDVLKNMLAGYAFVDDVLAADTDLFAIGNSKTMLEINNTVLYGSDSERRKRFQAQLAASKAHFYNERRGGGIGDLIEYYKRHQNKAVADRAALVYIRTLAQPQLFIEGNHRTGALLMSYILVRGGRPPFVLTRENAVAFFRPTASIEGLKKGGLAIHFRGPKLRRYLINMIRECADARYLL